MMPPYSCAVPGRNGHVDERHDGDIERVAKAYEARRLDRALDIETTGQHQRLVGDEADRGALHTTETDDDILRVIRLDLEKVLFVDDLIDQLLYIVGLVRIIRHQRIERGLFAPGRVFWVKG
jgi:hypothetical protein